MNWCFYDLETTDLKGDFGRILCGTFYLWPEDRYITLRQDDYVNRGLAKSMADDKEIASEMREILDSRGFLSAYYGKGFDVPLLQSRLFKNGLPLHPVKYYFDPIWMFKGWRGFSPRKASLAVVAEFLDLEDKKPHVDADTWVNARVGDKQAMDEVCERCEADTKLLIQVASRLFRAGKVPKSLPLYP